MRCGRPSKAVKSPPVPMRNADSNTVRYGRPSRDDQPSSPYPSHGLLIDAAFTAADLQAGAFGLSSGRPLLEHTGMAYSAEVFEKLGVFYLGRQYAEPNSLDAAAARTPVLYSSKDLTTHGVCVGMTGSGKTGLCLGLLEEAAIDQIPVIAIDPKGDVSNLLLTFPNLDKHELTPWLDPAVAEREGISLETFAEREAERLRAGLAEFGQDVARIQRLRDSVEMVIYTPGSQAGRPLSLLRSFAAPAADQLHDPELIRERVQGAVSGLLSLLGVPADPLRSREHILLCQILDGAFRAGRGLSLPELIQAVQVPAFTHVGVFELDTFYPKKDRLELAMSLNNLLAAPGAQALAQGDPLEILSLLRTSTGKPKLSIISIAHLNDTERMAFVTTLLSELIVWMRGQPGTSSLRALLYMDEIFGYFPPTAAPPSKQPMLTLLKQARAFGLGVMLATQNPVDLDYKGLSNCGTWFIGRLQTERDKARVLDGLEGAAATSGRSFDRSEMDRLLSGLSKRVFLLNNVHEGAPRLFETRATLCYLRGPLTRDEIKRLTLASASNARKTTEAHSLAFPDTPMMGTPQPRALSDSPATSNTRPNASDSPLASNPRPNVPSEAHEVFFPAFNRAAGVNYVPGIYARAKLHFVDKRAQVDLWRTEECWVPMAPTDADPRWMAAEPVPPVVSSHVATAPLPESHFRELPTALAIAKNYAAFRKTFALHLYQTAALVTKQVKELELTSAPDELPERFAARLEQVLRERRDEELQALEESYREAYEKLKSKLERAQAKLERERQKSSTEGMDVALAVGGGLLGALLGRKVLSQANVRRVRSATRRGAQAARARVEAEQAEQSRELLERAMLDLQREFEQEAAATSAEWTLEKQTIDERRLAPRKADITVETLQLAWRPE